MAIGKIIQNKKERLGVADQYHTIPDANLRGYLIAYSDFIDEVHRNEIIRTYNDPNLMAAFRAYRTFNDLNNKGFTDKKSLREIARIPAGPVYEFLRAYFEPTYGPKWLRNKKVLRHELVMPFWIVSHL